MKAACVRQAAAQPCAEDSQWQARVAAAALGWRGAGVGERVAERVARLVRRLEGAVDARRRPAHVPARTDGRRGGRAGWKGWTDGGRRGVARADARCPRPGACSASQSVCQCGRHPAVRPRPRLCDGGAPCPSASLSLPAGLSAHLPACLRPPACLGVCVCLAACMPAAPRPLSHRNRPGPRPAVRRT